MPAVAFVPILAEVALGATGVTAAIGGAVTGVLGAEVAGATILGATTVGEALTGAIIGSGTGAVTAAISGGDVGRGALAGGVSGGVAPVASGAISKTLGTTLDGDVLGRALTAGVSRGAGREIGAIAGGAATGQDIRQAAFRSAPGAIASGLIGAGTEYVAQQGVDPSTTLGRGISSLGQTGLTQALSGLPAFGGTISQTTGAPYTAPAPQATYQPAGAAPVASATPSPGFGGGPGAPVFGTEQQTSPTGVWGRKSLRGTDTDQTAQTGGAVG